MLSLLLGGDLFAWWLSYWLLPLIIQPAANIPNIDKTFTNIGHRFGHQSGLDESLRRKSSIFRLRIAFRVYLRFSQIGKNTKY